ncbi:prepilin peptidase [Vibrio lentus]
MILLGYLILLFICCLGICLFDYQKRIISNRILLVLILIQSIPLLKLSVVYFESVSIVFFFGMVIYSYHILAAGDIKYAAVLSLSIPMELLPSALLLTMLVGGVLASFYLLFNLALRIKANVYGGIDHSQYNTGIPYGVAISVGFYVMIFSHWVSYI